MYQRTESTKRVILEDGTVVNIRILDGLIIEDLVFQHMQASGYKLITGEDRTPTIKRDIKDYLIRLYTIS